LFSLQFVKSLPFLAGLSLWNGLHELVPDIDHSDLIQAKNGVESLHGFPAA
jgi:hypothetical protein